MAGTACTHLSSARSPRVHFATFTRSIRTYPPVPQLFFTLFYFMFVKIDESYTDGVGSSTTDNSAYDAALVVMTLIPPGEDIHEDTPPTLRREIDAT